VTLRVFIRRYWRPPLSVTPCPALFCLPVPPLSQACMCLPAFEPATCACTRAFLLCHMRESLLPLDSTDTPSTATPTCRNGLLTYAEKASLPSPTPCTDRLESQGALLSAPPASARARIPWTESCTTVPAAPSRAAPRAPRPTARAPHAPLQCAPRKRASPRRPTLNRSRQITTAALERVRFLYYDLRPQRIRWPLLDLLIFDSLSRFGRRLVSLRQPKGLTIRSSSSTSTGAISSLSARYTTAEGRLKALGGAARSSLWRFAHVHAHVDVPCVFSSVCRAEARRICRGGAPTCAP
jgi:hypothetical protein